jgi:hypothetical protein
MLQQSADPVKGSSPKTESGVGDVRCRDRYEKPKCSRFSTVPTKDGICEHPVSRMATIQRSCRPRRASPGSLPESAVPRPLICADSANRLLMRYWGWPCRWKRSFWTANQNCSSVSDSFCFPTPFPANTFLALSRRSCKRGCAPGNPQTLSKTAT